MTKFTEKTIEGADWDQSAVTTALSEFGVSRRNGRGRYFVDCPHTYQRDLLGNWQAPAKAADRHHSVEAAGVKETSSPNQTEDELHGIHAWSRLGIFAKP